MTYRRIKESPDQAVVRSSRAEQAVPRIPGDFTGDAAASCGVDRDDSVDEEIHHYARVHLLSQDLPLSDREWNRPISDKKWNLPLSRKEWHDLTEASATLKAELTSLDDSDESKRERIELELQYSGDLQRRDAQARVNTITPRNKMVRFWTCHDCNHINNRPERCAVCPHWRCASCPNA